MASPKTLALRDAPQPLRVFVCAACLERQGKNVFPGGTLRRSAEDGLLYHRDCLPERQA